MRLSPSLRAQDFVLLGEHALILGDGDERAHPQVEVLGLDHPSSCEPKTLSLRGAFDRLEGSTGSYALAFNDARYLSAKRRNGDDLTLINVASATGCATRWSVPEATKSPESSAVSEFPIPGGVQWAYLGGSSEPTFCIITFASTLVVLHLLMPEPQIYQINLRDTANFSPFGASQTAVRLTSAELTMVVRGTDRNDLFRVAIRTDQTTAMSQQSVTIGRIETGGRVDAVLLHDDWLAALVQPAGASGTSVLELHRAERRSAVSALDLPGRFDRIVTIGPDDGRVLIALEQGPGVRIASGSWNALTSVGTEPERFLHTTSLPQPIAHHIADDSSLWLFSLQGAGAMLSAETQLVRSFTIPGDLSASGPPLLAGEWIWALNGDGSRVYSFSTSSLEPVEQVLPAPARHLFAFSDEGSPKALAVHDGALVRFSSLSLDRSDPIPRIDVDEQRFVLLDEVASEP